MEAVKSPFLQGAILLREMESKIKELDFNLKIL
jgi:hypothetical protein